MRRKPRNPWTASTRTRRRKGTITPLGISARKQAYLAYINSAAWRSFRIAWWAEYDRRHRERVCYCCGKPQSALKRSLELHHRTYERLGKERWDDIVAVCRTDHQWITRAWRARGRTGLTVTLWELTEQRRRERLPRTAPTRQNTRDTRTQGPGRWRPTGPT